MIATVTPSRKPIMTVTAFIFVCASFTAYFQGYEMWIFHNRFPSDSQLPYIGFFDIFMCLINMTAACAALLYVHHNERLYGAIVEVVLVFNYLYSFRLLFGHLIHSPRWAMRIECSKVDGFKEWLEIYSQRTGISFLVQVILQIGLHVLKKALDAGGVVKVTEYKIIVDNV
ncbi:hypothetical protein QR680_012393 [Steinernema hermaphroditum]|uniref:Uncharacterized protein n=1 Tax=Steinernema hermaphroditum TaxID=289476 RepID=A0AA39I1W2_9BILA|nr:hypothetical protein QR680_012393 [Steinernema hermaphroditum]